MPNAAVTIDYVMHLHHSRTALAREIRRLRAILSPIAQARSTPMDSYQIVCLNRAVVKMAEKTTYVSADRHYLPRISRASFAELADLKLGFGHAEHGPIILDDGYACCGLEDARAEEQKLARHEGAILRNALRYMR